MLEEIRGKSLLAQSITIQSNQFCVIIDVISGCNTSIYICILFEQRLTRNQRLRCCSCSFNWNSLFGDLNNWYNRLHMIAKTLRRYCFTVIIVTSGLSIGIQYWGHYLTLSMSAGRHQLSCLECYIGCPSTLATQ